MALNRLLKLDIVLLAVLLGITIASSFLIYTGNRRFVGILGIALLACALVLWRIFTLTRQKEAVPLPEKMSFDFDIEELQKRRPPGT